MVDVDGTNQYISFDSLSGGEKACVTFVLLSMLSQLSGYNILIMDELSVLDKEIFEKLIKLIKLNENEFDMCMIACVNHSDIVELLNEEGISITELNRLAALILEKKKRKSTAKKKEKNTEDLASNVTVAQEPLASEPTIVSVPLPESFDVQPEVSETVQAVAEASGLAIDEVGDIFGSDDL